VDYLALGHIHKSYTEQDWIFNAGSVEANSIAESQDQIPRGVFRVCLTPEGIEAELKRDYRQRPIHRLTLKTQKHWNQASLEAQALTLVEQQNQRGQLEGAIVELRIQGIVGFNRWDLNLTSLQERLAAASQALIFRLKYEVNSGEDPLVINTAETVERRDIEAKVFESFLAGYQDYRDHLPYFSQALMQFKQQVLQGESVEALYATAVEVCQSMNKESLV
jgi:DNA repair exonuclease SbcCD nuclease subunit